MEWVTGHLTGGIGNRLFQHAAAAGLAEKWSIPFVFYLPECGPTNHGAFENIFKLFPRVPQINNKVVVERLAEPTNGVFTYTAFPEKQTSSYVSIDGWRQTELYFPKDGLFPDFDSAVPKERREALLQEFDIDTAEKKQNTWLLHVRLGDYKVLPHHQIDMNDYYTKAVKYIPSGSRVFLFSDEIGTYGMILQGFLREKGVDAISVNIPDELETLYMMSQCLGGAVVANSTFSWWGAYFARKHHPDPKSYIAIYPGMWGNGLPQATNIVPLWGIRIDNK